MAVAIGSTSGGSVGGAARLGCLRALSVVCVVTASVSAVAHLVGGGGLGVGTVVSVGMAAACVACAAHLVRHPQRCAMWFATSVMALAMIAVHVVWGAHGVGGHVHGVSAIVPAGVAGTSSAMSVMLVATSVELVVAVSGLWVATSGRGVG